MSEAAEGFNPEYDPTGIEGGLDTNLLPWIEVPNTQGISMKTVRASMESGMFSLVIKIEEGKAFPNSVFLGGMDLLVLSGELDFSQGGRTSVLKPGTWGFVPANTKIDSIAARGESEILINFFNGVSILNLDGSLKGILTAMDVNQLAKDAGVTMVPSSLADCAKARPSAYKGDPSPLAIAKRNANELVDGEPSGDARKYVHDFFIDAKTVPWIINPDLPDIGLKILRVSEETGVISLIVKHKGVATPHTHIGAADFLVLSGAIGYRAGPPEGYGAGMWFYEPAGARHESTQSLTDEPLIYTANVYGPLIFDSGKGTPVEAVLSWVEYVALAEGGGAKLVPNSEAAEKALLAWSPLES